MTVDELILNLESLRAADLGAVPVLIPSVQMPGYNEATNAAPTSAKLMDFKTSNHGTVVVVIS